MPAIKSLEDQYANLSDFFKAQQRTFVMWTNGKLMEGGNKPISTGAAACGELMDGTVAPSSREPPLPSLQLQRHCLRAVRPPGPQQRYT